MRKDNEAFERLGCDVRPGGSMPLPFDEPQAWARWANRRRRYAESAEPY